MHRFTAAHQLSGFLFLAFMTTAGLMAQVSNSLGVWVDHLPYGQSRDILSVGDDAIVATRQGLYLYNVREKTFRRISKVNGLSDVGISTLGWSERFREILVGYENGNLDIVTLDGQSRNFPDILLTDNFSGLKRINDIEVADNTAYLATDFGILNFDLAQDIVRETFIIGPGGAVLGVNDVTLDGERIYAATNQGLFSASLQDPLFFFESWKRDTALGGPLSHAAIVGERLFVNKRRGANEDSVFYRESGLWQFFADPGVSRKLDLRESKGNLVVVNNFSAREYNANLELVTNVVGLDTTLIPVFSPVAAAAVNADLFWVADAQYGLIENFQKLFNFRHLPNSPFTKNVHQLYHNAGKLYVAPANESAIGTPIFNNDGYFVLEEFAWENIPNQTFENLRDIHAMEADPEDPDHLYLSSYGNGIVEMQDGEFVQLITGSSTGGAFPELNGASGHRVGDFDTDEEGNIWFTNHSTDRILGKINPDGSIESFSLGALGSGETIDKIMCTSEGQIWMQTRRSGIIVVQFRDGILEVRQLTTTVGEGNLPSNNVLSFAEDLDGEIWIGTNEGLAVIFSPANIFENNRNFDASIIVIDEDGDGNGERVLGSEEINDIEVDGSNKKWFATTNSGVFFTSENGRQQLARFTVDNSPLPSNNVVDMEIDPNTGMVYFGTAEGIVSFQGEATEGVSLMSDVFAYPNPVEPDYEGPILIRGLVTNAQVKITDMQGNLVFETVAEGGQAIWNGKNFSGERIASGVYLAFITDDLGINTEVAKIMVLR